MGYPRRKCHDTDMAVPWAVLHGRFHGSAMGYFHGNAREKFQGILMAVGAMEVQVPLKLPLSWHCPVKAHGSW